MRHFLALVLLVLLFSVGVGFSGLSRLQIDGTRLPTKTVVISYDDLPYEKWQSTGFEPKSWTLAIAQYLAYVTRWDENGKATIGVPAVWFLVGCHFPSQPVPDSRGCICMGKRDADENIISILRQMGFLVGNHTQNHLPASKISPLDVINEFSLTQHLLDEYPTNEMNLYRAVGLDYPSWVAGVVNNDPYLRKLKGPIGVDVGGAFKLADGKWIGGDWDCPDKGLTPSQCGDLYLRDIREVTKSHGAIVLLHNYVIPGWYAYQLIRYIIENLDRDIEVVDIRTHPALQRPRRDKFPRLWY